MRTRDKKDEMILTLALLEQMENDEELKAFDSCENREPGKGEAGKEKEDSHIFSERHNLRMKQIFKIAAKAEKKRKRRRFVKRAAGGIAACLCISTCMMFSSSAFRLPVMNFFTEVKEKYSELIVDKETKTYVTKNFQEYEPGYVPRGFNVAKVIEKEKFFRIYYVDALERWYYFACYFAPRSTQVDTEKLREEKIKINGEEAFIYDKGEYIQVVMYKDSQQLSVIGNIELDEMVKILESICIN